MLKRFRSQRGFTLIELAVVLAILSVLAAAAVPYAATQVRNQAAEKVAREMLAIADAAKSYYVANSAWPASISTLQTGGYLPSGWNVQNPWGNTYTISSATSLTVTSRVPSDIASAVSRLVPLGTQTVVGSNVDVSGTWPRPGQSSDLSSMIPRSIVDAKGDLIAATANDTVTRLPVGSDGYVATADSTQPTGIRWAAPSGAGGSQLFTSNGTFTVPSGVTTVYVFLAGGGGGGGGSYNVTGSNGAGGGGADAKIAQQVSGLTAGQNISVSVGAGGAGGAAGGGNGGSGGTSCFGGYICAAGGGGGSYGCGGYCGAPAVLGGAAGGPGGAVGEQAVWPTIAGAGGNSIFGAGAGAIRCGGPGQAGGGFGGGGGGGHAYSCSPPPGGAGGPGAAGFVLVQW